MILKHSASGLWAFVLLCLTFTANAQYNKTWDYGKSADVVDIGGGFCTTLATDDKADIILTNLDFNGTAWFRRYYNLSNGEQTEDFEATKLLFTPNGEYLVVGIYTRITSFGYDYAPFAARFDGNGSLLWTKTYLSSPTQAGLNLGDYSRANIVFVEDDPNMESYIITAPSDASASVYSTVYINDVLVNGLRIDANGAVLWNKKYKITDVDRTTHPVYQTFANSQSYPQALTYFENGVMEGRYFIGGTNVIDYNYFRNQSTETFFMSIDKNGTMDVQHTRMDQAPSWWNDAIYDPTTQEVVMMSSMPNWSGLGSSASAIGIIKFDNALNITSTDYYHHDVNVTENYGRDITLDASGDNYVIGAWVFDEQTTLGTMAILKVEKSPMIALFYNRYNQQYSDCAAVISLTDPGLLTENYVMHGHQISVGPLYSSRVISTDINGTACGLTALNPQKDNVTFTTTLDPYDDIDVYGTQEPTTDEPLIGTFLYECPIHYFKKDPNVQTSIAKLNDQPAVSIYPTQIDGNAQSQVITLTVKTDTPDDLFIDVCTSEGKTISTNSFTSKAGNNSFQWNQHFPSKGIFLVRAYTQDGKINETVSLLKN